MTPRAEIVERLAAAGCVAAEAEAVDFLACAPDESTLDEWLHRRERGEPHAWIVGRTMFCGLSLHIAAGVYVPRSQTEPLAGRAAALLPAEGRAIDLCTGVGAVAAFLGASVPSATVIGVDLDRRAAACARHNGVFTIVGDLAASVRGSDRFDVVTAVVPYVPTGELRHLPSDVRRYEPSVALDGGADGLDVAYRVIAEAGRLLRPGGWLLIELGGDQDRAVARCLAHHGFAEPDAWYDDEGDLRGLACQSSAARSTE